QGDSLDCPGSADQGQHGLRPVQLRFREVRECGPDDYDVGRVSAQLRVLRGPVEFGCDGVHVPDGDVVSPGEQQRCRWNGCMTMRAVLNFGAYIMSPPWARVAHRLLL